MRGEVYRLRSPRGARGHEQAGVRSAVVVQSDVFNPIHASVTLCPITSDCVDAPLFRVAVPPGTRTGLRDPSQVMVDKIVSVPRSSIADEIGVCSASEMDAVEGALRYWLALD